MEPTFKTKSEIAYERLRRGILNGELKPGEKLVISNVSKELGISDIPVREAISKLESEGLLQIIAHVGAVVTKFDLKQYNEFSIIRGELETLAAKLATPHLKKDDFEFLANKIQEMKQALKEKKYSELYSLNVDFHLRIYKCAPYPYLYKLIVELWGKVQRFGSVFILVPERVALSIKEHKEILAALRKRDSSSVELLMRNHKAGALAAAKGFFEKGSGREAVNPEKAIAKITNYM